MFPRLTHRALRTLIETLLLVLLLCPAPVPVGHSHSDLGSDWSSDQMAMHLQACHGGSANADNWPSGWHWHWSFQVDTDFVANQEASNVQCHLSPNEVSQAASTFVCESKLDAWVWKTTLSRPLVSIDRRHSFTNIALLSSRQSLPELFGILRC